MGIRKRVAFKALSAGMALGAAVLARTAATRGWKLTTRREPPMNPASRKTSWKTALGFAVLSGATAAALSVVGQRAAAGLWRKQVGPLPKGVR